MLVEICFCLPLGISQQDQDKCCLCLFISHFGGRTNNQLKKNVERSKNNRHTQTLVLVISVLWLGWSYTINSAILRLLVSTNNILKHISTQQYKSPPSAPCFSSLHPLFIVLIHQHNCDWQRYRDKIQVVLLLTSCGIERS